MHKAIVAALLIIPQSGFACRAGEPPGFTQKLLRAAIERTGHMVRYDGSYRIIAYPNGDVPDNVGVCTDEVVRVYRKLGIDLQKDLHEDMKAHFDRYPRLWGLSRPDTNIDHRRVPNLQTLFRRKGIVLEVTDSGDDYRAGDIVTWMLVGRLPHIGIVMDSHSAHGAVPHIFHNIGAGPVIEDILFKYPITGHYRYYGNVN